MSIPQCHGVYKCQKQASIKGIECNPRLADSIVFGYVRIVALAKLSGKLSIYLCAGMELLHLQQCALRKTSHGRTYSFPGPCHKYRQDGSKAVRYASEPLLELTHAPALDC